MLFTELEVSLRECLLRIATFNAPLPHDPTNTSFEVGFIVVCVVHIYAPVTG